MDRHNTEGRVLAAWRTRTKDKLSKRAIRRFRSVASVPSLASSSPSARQSSYFGTPPSSTRLASTSPSSVVSVVSTPARPAAFRPVVRATPKSPPPRSPLLGARTPAAAEATPATLSGSSRLSSEYFKARAGGAPGTPVAKAAGSGAAEAVEEEVTTEEEPEAEAQAPRGGLREALQARLRR